MISYIIVTSKEITKEQYGDLMKQKAENKLREIKGENSLSHYDD
jgi:hypothetical protein